MGAKREYEGASNEPDNRRGNRDINAEAVEGGTTPERIRQQASPDTEHDAQSTDQQSGAAPGAVNPGRLQDGYSVTQGADYQQEEPGQQVREGYDPTHSGVRHAQNKPGMRANTPGREGQTGWAEQLQNGQTTDTPNNENPVE